jgi:hypothetical protein
MRIYSVFMNGERDHFLQSTTYRKAFYEQKVKLPDVEERLPSCLN